MADSEEVLKEGAKLGSYTIVRLLGEGGMGEVYEAVHSGLDKRVAIKTLHGRMAGDAGLKARFLREGKAASKIRHPHVVDVTDVGEENGVPYLVMEFLVGQDLAQKIESTGAVGIQETVDLMLPVCAAIAAAHDVDIVHRDLKPDNVFLAEGAHGIAPKVFDFGIAKVFEQQQNMALTGTAAVLGTPYYMSPEQARSTKNVGPLSDQYSLGVLMYEALTGRRPFEHDTLFDLLNAIVGGTYTPLHDRVPNVPPDLVQIVACAMHVNPAQRFPSVRHLGQALLPFASDRMRSFWTPEFSRVQPHELPPASHKTAVMCVKEFQAATQASMAQSGPQQFVQSGPQQFAQSGPQQFVQSGPQQFAQSGPQQFVQSGPQQFVQSGPQQFAQSGPQQLAQSGSQQFPSGQYAGASGPYPQLGQSGKLEVTTFSGTNGERLVFEPGKKSRLGLFLAAAGVLVIVGGGVATAVILSGEETSAPVAANPPPQEPSSPSTPSTPSEPVPEPTNTNQEAEPTTPPPAEPAVYTVQVTVTPSTAEISLDGEDVGIGTFSRSLPIDGASHTLRISAEGYETQNFTFRDQPPPSEIALVAIEQPVETRPTSSRSERRTVPREGPGESRTTYRPPATSRQPRQGANNTPILY